MEGVEKKGYKDNLILYNKSIENKKMANSKTQLNTINKNIDNINMESKYISFKLGFNTKDPSNPHAEWAKAKRHLWQPRSFKQLQAESINHGLPCGKVNGFWVLDIDNYKDKEKCLFTKTFGDVLVNMLKNIIFLQLDQPAVAGIYIFYIMIGTPKTLNKHKIASII